jgi:hypothetical protein
MNIMKTIFMKGIKFLILSCVSLLLFACEGNLENVTYGSFSSSTFFKTANDAKAALSGMYIGMVESTKWNTIVPDNELTTDVMVSAWNASLHQLIFTPDDGRTTSHYLRLMPIISNITLYISKINGINMDNTTKQEYIGELKALRAYYTQMLYLYYGPVPIRTDPSQVDNPNAPILPRPSNAQMVAQILQDDSAAIAVLPNMFSGPNYGRFSKAACLATRMKLYMQLHQWNNAIADGEAIKAMGIFHLVPNYTDNFNYNNKGGNSEIIFAIVCTPNSVSQYNNLWLANSLPTDYKDTTGVPLTAWGGYRMPWKTYDKFDQRDKRLSVLLQRYPVGRNAISGQVEWRDARTGLYYNGTVLDPTRTSTPDQNGAVIVKYGVDPTKTNSIYSGVDIPIIRYADVELMLAEAINNANNGPNQEAFSLINDVRTRAGLPNTTANDQASFQIAIQNERLFEFFAEGYRRNDLIRWGLFIQRAINDGYTNVDNHLILFPLPRTVVTQSNGVITQNPGYN